MRGCGARASRPATSSSAFATGRVLAARDNYVLIYEPGSGRATNVTTEGASVEAVVDLNAGLPENCRNAEVAPLRRIDNSRRVQTDQRDAREAELGAFWCVWHYDFATESSHEVEALPEWIGHAHYVNLGDFTAFVYWEESEQGNRTTFYRVNGASDPTRLFSFDASWYSFGKLR